MSNIFFSGTTLSFYFAHVHGAAMPSDAKPVTQQVYDACVGRVLAADQDGGPCLASDLARSLADWQATLLDAATAQRWLVETGGVALPSGVRVGTEKADQDRITAVLVNAAAAGLSSIDFKAASGWVTLTLAELQAIATAIALHVQSCFTAERAHHEAIGSLQTVAAAQAYDVLAGWPAQ